MPLVWLYAYETMRPRLEAQERIAAIQDAVASNERSMDDRDRSTFMNQLDRQAQGFRRRVPREADEGALRASGIEVVVEGEDEQSRPAGGGTPANEGR